MVLWVMVANGCLIEARGISSQQKEPAQSLVLMLFLPETPLSRTLFGLCGTTFVETAVN